MSSTRVNFTRGRPRARPRSTSISFSRSQSAYETYLGLALLDQSLQRRRRPAPPACSV